MDFNIQFLPALVTDHLLTFLDPYDRLTLRLVSKTTKRWIDTKDFLQILKDFHDCPKFIKNQLKRAEHLGTISTNINRITINFKDFDDNELPKLKHIFGPNLRFLKLVNFTGDSWQIKLIAGCSNLESLSIDTLNLTRNPTFPESSEEYGQNFHKILGNLEHFSLERISIIYPGSTELEYFGKLLKLLGNLKSLNIPRMFTSFGVDITAFNDDHDTTVTREGKSISLSINFGFVIGPIIKYISRRSHASANSKSPLQNLTSLDLTNFDLSFFELFPELIKTCNKSGTELDNVNFALIRKLIAMRYDSKLLRIVQSVWNKLVGNASVFPDLQNVQSLKLDCDKCEIFIPSGNGNPCFFPEVKQMELCVWSDTEFSDNVSSPIRDILIRSRRRLRKLVLTCNDRCKLLIPIQTLTEMFGNLTELQCKTFPMFTDSQFGNILRNLKLLKVLEIDDEWGGITDLGINSANPETGQLDFLNLTALVKLRLKIRCKYTGDFYPNGRQYSWPWAKFKRFSTAPNAHFVSDYSFKNVFRHLKLKSFLVDSADIHLTKLGYQHLLEGAFAETVEYFPLPEYLPTGMSEEEFYLLRHEFKYFKSLQPLGPTFSTTYHNNRDYNNFDKRGSEEQSDCILS